MKISLKILVPALVTALIGTCGAQVVRDSVPELQGIDIEEHLGDTLPLNLAFSDDHGNAVTLADYFHQGRPVLLVLGYYRCPMLCNLVFNGVSQAVPGTNLQMGQDFQIVTVSINPKETPELAAAKKKTYLEDLGASGSPDGWAFLTGDSGQSKALAAALGFDYYYMPDKDQYAHPAAIYLISPSGVISRYLYGIQYNPRDLRLGLLEASEGKVGTTVDRIILYCYHYDPDSGGYTILAQNVMMVGGVITVILLGAFLGMLWMRDRYKKAHSPTPEQRHHSTVG